MVIMYKIFYIKYFLYLNYIMDPRILYSLESAILFFIVASPYMYNLTRKMIKLGTYGSVALHSVVFGVLVYVLMRLQ